MSAYSEAHPGSRELCDLIHERLSERIPNLKMSQTQAWCSLHRAGGNRFAYIQPRKRKAEVQIWCAGRVEDLLKHSALEVQPREKMKPGWETTFPARFYVRSKAEVGPAADLLYNVSYRAV
jgi:hypothetical protein